MFMEFRDQPPPPRWEPDPVRPRLTPRQRRIVEGIVLFNLLMALCAPLAGATLFEEFVALMRQ